MWLVVLTWTFETLAAAAIGAAVTGGLLFAALALLLHSPHEAKMNKAPYYVGDTGAPDTAS